MARAKAVPPSKASAKRSPHRSPPPLAGQGQKSASPRTPKARNGGETADRRETAREPHNAGPAASPARGGRLGGEQRKQQDVAPAARRPRRGAAAALATDPLATYRAKRDFSKTPEPPPGAARRGTTLSFTIQRHDARRLHYDFRLELEGVLKSWAVPKGPSLDPAQKRLAVQTEDHPLDYGSFEGAIPAGEYGGGDVLLWDRGSWRPLHDAADGLARGKLHFELSGHKLQGEWVLVRLAPRDSDRAGVSNWLLRKLPDAFARAGSDDAVVREQPDSVAHRERLAQAAAPAGGAAPTRNGTRGTEHRTPRAVPAPPDFIAPQLATRREHAPTGSDWVYEVKFDGYRMLARVDAGRVTIVSRNAQDWTARLPTLAAALSRLPLRNAWLDGEITMSGADGRSSFQALQNALDGAPARVEYQLFDVMWLDGEDLRAQPLAQRYARLQALLAQAAAPLLLSGQLEADGATAWDAACRMQLEGLIGKRRDAPYLAGRSPHWIKLKCRPADEFVIGGWTDPAGSRSVLGALLVGVHEDGRLRYAGRVGTGFTEATLARLRAALAPLARDASPFDPVPRLPRGNVPHWVEPRVVAQIEYAEITGDGLLRQASFVGLREDKPAREVVAGNDAPLARRSATAKATTAQIAKRAGAETTSEVASSALLDTLPKRITHADRAVYANGLTKLDVARYYATMAPHMLAELRGRPLSLLRCPQGTQGTCFFQKHIATRMPPGLVPVQVQEKDGPAIYIAVDREDGLVSLAQHAAIELHPWGSRLPQLTCPDRLIIDLDPDESIDWPTLLEAAWLARALLQELGLVAFVRTTGGKGLHVVSPLAPRAPWSTVKPFAQAIARQLARVAPQRFTSNMAKDKRRGRIFIDYLRNAEGATAIASFSLRARPGAPVAMPVAWDELKPKRDLRTDHFNLRNATAAAPAALAAWAGFDAQARPLDTAMLAALGLEPSLPLSLAPD